jgi:tripartite-type tricarboxylate transporter receptor subunit TctC
MAKSMHKYLPGSTIIVKNIPGAGHIIGCNAIHIAKPDGLTFGIFSAALPLAQVAGLKGIKFDLTKMSWLGSAAHSRQTYFVSTRTPYRTIDDIMKAEVVKQAAGGVGSLNYVFALLFPHMKGLDNIKISTGYHGGEDMLAMMRGEVHAEFHSWGSVEKFIKDGNAVPIMFIAEKQPPGQENVPLIQDVVKEEKYQATVTLMRTICSLGRPFAGPPGIPKDRLKVLRNAFAKALDDKEAQKIAKKAKRPINYTNGEDALTSIESVLKISPDTVALIKKAHGFK